MRKFSMTILLMSAFLIFATTINGIAAELQVNKDKENLVKFISDAPLEDFEGTTDKIDGYMNLTSWEKIIGSKLYFEVDLNSIDTGIGLRNRHMRENYLHTDKKTYQFTNFEGTIIEANAENKDRYKVKVKGKMYIHGVSRDKEIEGYVTTNHSGSFRINSDFSVKLTDYNIEVPQVMVMKIDENIKLKLDFYLKETN